jgi:hypothetical protein
VYAKTKPAKVPVVAMGVAVTGVATAAAVETVVARASAAMVAAMAVTAAVTAAAMVVDTVAAIVRPVKTAAASFSLHAHTVRVLHKVRAVAVVPAWASLLALPTNLANRAHQQVNPTQCEPVSI